MHEMSIALALLRLAKEHRPADSVIQSVHVQVGPLQAIDTAAMQFAWRAATEQADMEGAQLELKLLPWRLRCTACGRLWEAQSIHETCDCGAGQSVLVGGDELLLVSLEVAQTCDAESSIGRGGGLTRAGGER